MSTPAQERKRRIKVGAFLALTVAVLVGVVFVLGRSQGLLVRKITLRTSFANISGLIVGAPVRLGGLDVGLVESVRFSDDLEEKRVHVVLGIERRYLSRIRADSVARLTSKGLLGDSIINVSVGSAAQAAVAPNAWLPSEEAEDVAELADEARAAITAVRALSTQLTRSVSAIVTPDFAHDVGRIAKSTASVVEQAEHGNGLLHTLLYDRAANTDGQRMLTDAARAIARVDRLIAAVEHGQGALHSLVYERDGKAMLSALRGAATDVNAVAAELRSGRGLLHGLIYDKAGSEIVANLTALSRDLKQVGDDVHAGRGSIGGLLRDPTVYEDLKIVLGNVKRNRLLRALVRYTIKKDGLVGNKVESTKVE